jgi:nucleosome assembly protein 1-like 1
MSTDNKSAEIEEEEVSVQIEKGIKALDLPLKIKAVALNHYLEKKKELDEELEKEMKALTLKYEKLSEPIYTK